jgi:hypothetical protein
MGLRFWGVRLVVCKLLNFRIEIWKGNRTTADPRGVDSIGSLGAGAATNANPAGWRNIFWIQAGFFAISIIGLFLFYHPNKSQEHRDLPWKTVLWACDPIGSTLFIVSATLMLLALDWAGDTYPWHDAHVVAPLTIGIVAMLGFAVYGEWLLV